MNLILPFKEHCELRVMKERVPHLTFYGAAGTVTGSKTLLSYNEKRVLVDCGLFQGLKELRGRNWKDFDIPPREIDEVIITHGHLDHCGYLPRLVKDGFNGPIHCTHPSIDLIKIILEDSAKIQEEEAERANRYGYTSHKEAKPLYPLEDVQRVLPLLVGHDYSEWVIIDPDISFQLHNAGHILGSSMVEMKVNDKTIVFSGDLGQEDPLLLESPKLIKHADYVVLESTYGDRLHPETPAIEELEAAIHAADKKNGILIIPTFAVERAQEIIYLISELKNANRIPDIPVFLDSPMGINATKVFLKYPSWHAIGEQRCKEMCHSIYIIKDAEHSRKVREDNAPKIVLAGSGMLTGGRVLHHLDKHIDNPETTLLLAGFQAEGTRGRQLQEGLHEVKFFGNWRKVKIEIHHTTGLSAHADQNDLIDWVAHIKNRPSRIFLNHGESMACHTLALKLKDTLGLEVTEASPGVRYALDD